MAQCGTPFSQIDLYANNIQARILNGGDLFNDLADAAYFPNPTGTTGNPSSIYAAGLWMGGYDAAGNLKIAAVNYRGMSGGDYTAGPLTENGTTDDFTCYNWDRHFLVRSSDIAAFLNALPLTKAQAIAQFPSVMGWPGKGNNTFEQIWGFQLPLTEQSLAPFVDVNEDGDYTPLEGDYPAVMLRGLEPFIPDQIIWCVFNDQNGGGAHPVSKGKAIQAEVQLTSWAFHCADNPIIDNTIFTSHKIIYRGAEEVDSFYVGMWVDFDLGCYQDDYVGCDPSRNTMYVYNIDLLDGHSGNYCDGVATFKDEVPVQSATFLTNDANTPGASLDKFIAYSAGAVGNQDPATAAQFYNALSGSWSSGLPVTYGGTGFGGTTPVSHAFPDDPADLNGWSMCSAGLPAVDRKAIGSHYIGRLAPGAVEELNIAWSTHYNTPPPCNAHNALLEVDTILAYYINSFSEVCSPLSKAPVLPPDSVDLFPNPTTNQTLLRYNNLVVQEVRVYDAIGRLVQVVDQPGKTETTIQVQSLATGVYSLQMQTSQGRIIKKLAVVR